MARVSSEDCLEQVPNHFALCILGARRARELTAGKPSLVTCENKVAVTALREIAAGHVSFAESVPEAISAHIAHLNSLDGTHKRVRTGKPR